MSDKMFETLFQLKFQSKQLARAAAKEEKLASKHRQKVAAWFVVYCFYDILIIVFFFMKTYHDHT